MNRFLSKEEISLKTDISIRLQSEIGKAVNEIVDEGLRKYFEATEQKKVVSFELLISICKKIEEECDRSIGVAHTEGERMWLRAYSSGARRVVAELLPPKENTIALDTYHECRWLWSDGRCETSCGKLDVGTYPKVCPFCRLPVTPTKKA